MLFSSTIFLFCFLPMVVILYMLVGKGARQYVLLLSSLLFYSWGEPKHVAIMLLVCVIGYIMAILLDIVKEKRARRILLAVAIIVDLAILGYYKYANFFIDNINAGLGTSIHALKVIMPIGISFFIFQAMSYVIDVYRKDVQAQKSFAKLVLYVSFFPQLIAGPIVKYHDIEKDLEHNESSFDDVLYGVQRFIIGLGKKVLLANPLGAIADPIFNNGYQAADISIAWLGAIAYSMQLFFDFSGYSDMAIGLGRIFGFHFLENFNYPYISKSITEFWRRWHISLGTWFKEYVYIPLGGNRKGKHRTYINLSIVFLVTGMWHGASWTFIVWGIWHGLFIVVERITGINKTVSNRGNWLRHVYTILAFVVGWVIFRAETISEGLGFVKTMFGVAAPTYVPYEISYYINGWNVLVLCLGLLFCLPVGKCLEECRTIVDTTYGKIAREICVLAILIVSISFLAASTYNPFIYFRF